jgi:hypothetical protein
VEWWGFTRTACHTPLSQLLSDPLDLAGNDGPPSLDLVLLLLLLLLVTSSGAEPYLLVHVPWHRSPSSSTAHRLSPAIESHNLVTQPLPDGAAWWANRWSSWLLHGLLRSDGASEPEGPASLEGSTIGGLGAAREGVSECHTPKFSFWDVNLFPKRYSKFPNDSIIST